MRRAVSFSQIGLLYSQILLLLVFRGLLVAGMGRARGIKQRVVFEFGDNRAQRPAEYVAVANWRQNWLHRVL